MKAILNKFNKDDTGASSIIEMTLIFPLVLFVMGFLIYLACYVLQSVTMYNDAQRIAIAASRESAMPGYEYLYKGQGVTTKADFNWPEGSAPDIDIINQVMKKHEPYRYWGTGLLNESEKTTLEENLERLVANSSFLASSNVDCTITPVNNLISQQVRVRVVKYVDAPGFVKALGITDNISIDVTAVAVVGDPAEFIRNTDMVFDLMEYVFEEVKFGPDQKTLSEQMSTYKQKFSDVCAKIGISW